MCLGNFAAEFAQIYSLCQNYSIAELQRGFNLDEAGSSIRAVACSKKASELLQKGPKLMPAY